jgi:DNA-binding MarR family transcriptional regulator
MIRVVKSADAVAAIERALVRIRRSQTRRSLGRLATREVGEPVDLTLLGVVDAVEEGPDRDGQPVSVGTVGDRLGIDPSRASRVVSRAIQGGYLRRVASQTDGRRIGLELTAAGEELAAQAHRFRRSFFTEVMRDWSAADRREFASLLTRFVDGMAQAAAGEQRDRR